TAIEATNEQALSAALAKWMSKESVEERQINGIQVWERVTEEPEIEPLAIPGLSPIGGDPPPAAEEDEEGFERVLPNSASCVAMGHLLVASDIEYLREILEGFGQHERLSASPDYLHVAALMEKVAPGERSGWIFARTDE